VRNLETFKQRVNKGHENFSGVGISECDCGRGCSEERGRAGYGKIKIRGDKHSLTWQVEPCRVLEDGKTDYF